MKALTGDIDKVLLKMRLPPYYEQPRFHVSIAWSTHTSSFEGDALPFDDAALDAIERELGKALRREELDASVLHVKIGKDVFSTPFT